MTQQPQDAITRAQADDACQQWEAELGTDPPTRTFAWENVDELFRRHAYPSWLAAQYFVSQADELGVGEAGGGAFKQQHAALKVRVFLVMYVVFCRRAGNNVPVDTCTGMYTLT